MRDMEEISVPAVIGLIGVGVLVVVVAWYNIPDNIPDNTTTTHRAVVTSTHFGQVNDWYTVKFGHHTAKVFEEGGAMPNKGSHVKVKVTRDNKTGKISKVSED